MTLPNSWWILTYKSSKLVERIVAWAILEYKFEDLSALTFAVEL